MSSAFTPHLCRSDKLTLAGIAGDEWTECFTSYGTVLPLAPYVGFSALTGDVSDNHECVSLPPPLSSYLTSD